MTHNEMIDVIAAHRDGKIIQSKQPNRSDNSWCTLGRPVWDFSSNDYRVRPEPQEFWIVIDSTIITNVFRTESLALEYVKGDAKRVLVHVKEVL